MGARHDSDGISLRNNNGNSSGRDAGGVKGQCALMMEKFILRGEKGVFPGLPCGAWSSSWRVWGRLGCAHQGKASPGHSLTQPHLGTPGMDRQSGLNEQ